MSRELSLEENLVLQDVKRVERDALYAIASVLRVLETHKASILRERMRYRPPNQEPDPRDAIELQRIEDAEPQRWVAIAKTQLQLGFMSLTRALEQP